MRKVKINKSKETLLNNFLKELGQFVYKHKDHFVTEQDIADKYKVEVEDVIKIEKQAILFEYDERDSKKRRNKILINLYRNGLDFYKEKDGINCNFTDAIILNDKGEILFLLRNNKTTIEPKKWGLPGGHLEKSLSPERNVKKEIKEETNLDILECILAKELSINSGKNKIYYFICTLPKEFEIVLSEDEHTQYKWMSLKSLSDMNKEEFVFDLKEIILTKIFNYNK